MKVRGPQIVTSPSLSVSANKGTHYHHHPGRQPASPTWHRMVVVLWVSLSPINIISINEDPKTEIIVIIFGSWWFLCVPCNLLIVLHPPITFSRQTLCLGDLNSTMEHTWDVTPNSFSLEHKARR